MDPVPTDAGFLREDQILTWQKTIENTSDLCPFKTYLVEAFNARATMQIGQWPSISAIIGQSNLFEEVRIKFSLGLAKYDVNTPEFMNTQNMFNEHLAKVQNMEFALWFREADALWRTLYEPEAPSPGDPASSVPTAPVPMQVEHPATEVAEDGELPSQTDTQTPVKQGIQAFANLADSFSKEQLMRVALSNKPREVSVQTWMVMTEEERRLITQASGAMSTPISPTPLAVTEEPMFNGTKRMKYPDKLYPAPAKFTGAASGMPVQIFIDKLTRYLSTQLRTDAPNESEWGELIACHLEGDAAQVLHAAEKGRGKFLSWSEACTVLVNTFRDLSDNPTQLLFKLDALSLSDFKDKGGVVQFCHEYQKLAGKVGTHRSNADHVKRLLEKLPERMSDFLQAKCDFTDFTQIELTDVLTVLRTSQFGAQTSVPLTSASDDGNAAGRGSFKPRGGRSGSRGRGNNKWHRNSGGSDAPKGPHTPNHQGNSGHHPRPEQADHRNNKRAKHGNGNNKVEAPFSRKENFLHMLETSHATQARQSSDNPTSCAMPRSKNLPESVLEPHATITDLKASMARTPQQPGLGDNSQFKRVFVAKQEPSFDMSAPGTIAGIPVIVKLDTQASTSYLPAHIAAAAGVCLGPIDHNVKASVADGHQLNVYGIYDCKFEMQKQGLRAQVIVADLPENILYLGQDWLTAMGARLNFDDGTFSIVVDKNKLVFQADSAESNAEGEQPSDRQQGGNQFGLTQFLCSLKLNASGDLSERMSTVNPAVKELLAEFQDLFPETLPASLPPYRGTQHVIDLDPAIPVKPGYTPRHSPKEKA